MQVMYQSTRGKGEPVTASQAILKGLSEDGGLFVPTSIPSLDVSMEELSQMSYQETAYQVMSRLLTDFTEEELRTCINSAYDKKFDTDVIAPLKEADGAYFLELFHGPTIAFKDMALSILPYLMTTAAKKNNVKNEIVILTATSGDTGKAALAGFADVPGTRIIVFYPKHGVSPIQEKQMVTQKGTNTYVVGITGNFDDATETAVLKLQGVNGLAEDGKVGQQTYNLMYSDDIKANMLAYGEKSDVVLACQQRLKDLGYLTTTPDGTYGQDTVIAVKQFQARNDQVVDGYLGPSTRIVLNSSDAKPNGLMIGEQGDSVTRVQQLLSKYGYLPSSNVTGYYGEATEDAVKNFQSRNGLSADGKVGVQTMAKLTSDNVKKPAPTTAASTKSNKSNSSSNKNNSSSKGNSGGNTSSPAPRPASGAGVSALISVASSKLGSPYVWGAKGPSSFDCSGFVYWCLKQVGVSQSYMTSSGWRSAGRYTKVSNFNDIQAGDIVVVRGHVGIAAGGGTVIDASSSNGKVVHRGLSSWWRSNFVCAWRIF